MRIYGEFLDFQGNTCSVEFLKNDGVEQTRTIGEDGLFFGETPVIISRDNDDLTAVIVMSSAEINLVAANYVGDLFFANNYTDITVTIRRSNSVVWRGYVEPQTYSQPFARHLDEITINCADKLSTLQMRPYLDATPSNYDYVRANVATEKRQFRDVIMRGLPEGDILYDCSKGVTQGAETTLFEDVAISDYVFLGDDPDNVATWEEAVTAVLRYCNLHVRQEGSYYLIYDIDSLAHRRNRWVDIDLLGITPIDSPLLRTMTSEMHAADDTQISVNEAFNQISLTCKMDDGEELITNPLDSDTLTSQYANKQLFMSEFFTSGSLTLPMLKKWLANVKGTELPDGQGNKVVDWWVQVKTNKNWRLWVDGQKILKVDDLTEYDTNGVAINQFETPRSVLRSYHMPAFLSLGSVERATSQNNEPTPDVSMSDYLVIAVNGDDSETHLSENQGLIEYVGSNSVGTLTPPDDQTINYLVFGGKMRLQPLTQESMTFAQATQCDDSDWMDLMQHFIKVGDDDANNVQMYTRKFFDVKYPNTVPSYSAPAAAENIQPPTANNGVNTLKYNYSRDVGGRETDLISKLQVLECELIIGNKRLIERDIDENGNSTFEWVPVGAEPTITVDGVTYKITTFTLGFNPARGDYIVGREYNMQNTITPNMNLGGVSGTAIPIKRSDALSGAVIFRMLGPINTTWNNVTRRHATWFRHSSFQANDVQVLQRVQNIYISDFTCKLLSNNALNSVDEEKELIYISDVNHDNVNKYDAEEWQIITQPTSAECVQLGIKNKITNNCVIDVNTGAPLVSLYNDITGETAKAEQHYVDDLYRKLSQPRITMDMTLHSDDYGERDTFYSAALRRNFMPVSQTYDLKACTVECKLIDIE